VFVIIN